MCCHYQTLESLTSMIFLRRYQIFVNKWLDDLEKEVVIVAISAVSGIILLEFK